MPSGGDYARLPIAFSSRSILDARTLFIDDLILSEEMADIRASKAYALPPHIAFEIDGLLLLNDECHKVWMHELPRRRRKLMRRFAYYLE